VDRCREGFEIGQQVVSLPLAVQLVFEPFPNSVPIHQTEPLQGAVENPLEPFRQVRVVEDDGHKGERMKMGDMISDLGQLELDDR